MLLIENTILVLSNGKTIHSTPSLSTNTCTFMYMNKSIITTMEALRLQQQQIEARNAIKRSQSAQQLHT
jgi:hypothetical protein